MARLQPLYPLQTSRNHNAELQKLRGEANLLGGQIQEQDKLRAADKQLQALITAKQAAAPSSLADDYFTRLQCVDNMKHMGISFRLWAEDNNHMLPPDFLNMTNELSSWKVLQCPGDKAHSVGSWSDVRSGNVSYQFLVPGIRDSEDPNTVVFECPVHHNITMLDGAVPAIERRRGEESLENGKRQENFRPMRISAPLAGRLCLVLVLAGGIAAIAHQRSSIDGLRGGHQELMEASREAQRLAQENREIPRLLRENE